MTVSSKLLFRSLALALGLLAACGGGGGGGGSFAIESLNLANNQVWQINRPILIRFSEPVDFATVSLNTINIRQVGGAPSAGEFSLQDASTVKFQPRCPLEDDLSDAGLLPGGVQYELKILGVDQGSPLTVKSAGGESLEQGDTRFFSTPVSLLPSDLFFDSAVGPPSPIVRSTLPGDTNPNACYLEIAGNDNQRHYFEKDLGTGAISLDPPLAAPLNLLALQASKVELVLFFNQAINPSSSNVSGSRLPWQFQDANGLWTPLATKVTLEANCTETGSAVRIVPQGLLPSETTLRALVTTQFEDIVGEKNILVLDTFAIVDTQPAPVPFVDEVYEPFASAANDDAQAPFAEPHASWGGGTLQAQFGFQGTGGPNGTFDWRIPPGQVVIFDTVTQTITGGPNFSSQTSVVAQNGIVDLNDFWIEAGATLKVQGPNPLVILTSGTARIDGLIDCSGADSPGVFSLNTTNIPEPGATGNGGGGKGGTGSPLTTASSPRGGSGFGAFNLPDGGGQGGETGWALTTAAAKAARRGAGGGGGVLGSNQLKPASQNTSGPWSQQFIGLDAEDGFPNTHVDAKGAITGDPGPFGGIAGVSPFVDDDPANDFFGTMIDSAAGKLIFGELQKPWAGAGGGGGGDSSFVPGGTFPNPVFNIAGDEKGSGGGGGGGGVQIYSLGNITFGTAGTILSRGGTGGGGENTSFVDRIGGGSGGGSGGHVILQTAAKINLSQFVSVNQSAGGAPFTQAILATGAQGGAGAQDLGGSKLGSTGKVETTPKNDACPPDYSTAFCFGHVDSTGGDGGPGIIQLHTNNGLSAVDPDIVLPAGKVIGDMTKPTAFGYPDSGTSNNKRLVPSFGSLSRARSKWIALGEGGFDPTNPIYKDLLLSFGGTDPITGLVQTTSQTVNALPPIMGPQPLAVAPALPHIKADGYTLEIAASALVGGSGGQNGYFTANPHLLKGYLIELSSAAVPTNLKRFQIASASYQSAASSFLLVVETTGSKLSSFNPGGALNVSVRPAFFRIATGGTPDSLPSSATVQISFQATVPDVNGDPDESVASASTFDISDLSGTNVYRFLRFEVLFDIDAQNTGLTPQSPRPAIDFLRIPLRFE